MTQKTPLVANRHHVLIFDEDWEYLARVYGPGGVNGSVGISRAIRTMIHQRVLGLKARERDAIDNLPDAARDPGEEGVRL